MFLFIGLAEKQARLSEIRLVMQGILIACNRAVNVAALHVELADVNVMRSQCLIVGGSLRMSSCLRLRRRTRLCRTDGIARQRKTNDE